MEKNKGTTFTNILDTDLENLNASATQKKKEPAVKYDNEKPSLDLLPSHSLEQIAKVLDFGAEKYGKYNWMAGMSWSRLLGATLRHIFKFISGEDIDKESNLPHLAHAGSCILFLLWYTEHRNQFDDRYKEEKNG